MAQNDSFDSSGSSASKRPTQASPLTVVQLANDLRNLLGVMTSCVDSLRNRMSADADDRDFAELEGAIDSAFSVSRELVPGDVEPGAVSRVVNVNDLLTQARGVLERVLGDEIRLSLELGATAPVVEADPVQLEWVVLSLAANARDAMPHGGVASIETRSMENLGDEGGSVSRRGQPFVRLTFNDVGGGMNADVQNRAFDPFFTTKRGRLGLGLTSAMLTVRRLGGWLHLESTPGVGSHLHVYLPALTSFRR
jgi:two-component system cell cycle sensor histidine kinase/response regulator CckA